MLVATRMSNRLSNSDSDNHDSNNPVNNNNLRTALAMLRNGHDTHQPSNLATVDQGQAQVPIVPTAATTSSNIFGFSQSLDITNDFEFSPPHQTHPSLVPSHPSSSITTPLLQAVTTPCLLQAVPTPPLLQAVPTSPLLQAVPTPPLLQAVTTPPLLQAVTSPPLLQAVTTPHVLQTSDDAEHRDSTSQQGNDDEDLEGLMENSRNQLIEQRNEQEDLVNLMESSRDNILTQGMSRQAEESRREVISKERKIIFKSIRVPGEVSTTSDTMSSEGEVFIEPSNYRGRRKSGATDQMTPRSVYVPPVQIMTKNREAALNTDTTESEPEPVVVPDLSQPKEDKRPRRVPQVKIHHSQENHDLHVSHIADLDRQDQSVTLHGSNEVTETINDRDRTPPLLDQEDMETASTSTDIPSNSQQSSYSSNTTSQTESSTTIDRSGSVTTVTTSTSSGSTSIEASGSIGPSQDRNNSQSINSQTLAEPLFSSTPNEADLDTTVMVEAATPTTSSAQLPMLPPNGPPIPPIKHSSTDISTSSSGTSGYTMKTKGITHFEAGTISTSTSQSIESIPPLAIATPPIDTNISQEVNVSNDVIPATPLTDEGDDAMETQDIIQSSQDELFQPSSTNSQIPRWITNQPGSSKKGKEKHPPLPVNTSSESESSFDHTSIKRPRTNSISDSNSSRKKPFVKRQRLSGTPISPDINEPPNWLKKQIKPYHSTPSSSSNNATPSDSPLVSSTGTSPERSSQSSLTSVGSDSVTIFTSLSSGSSGYTGSISSGGGSTGFTPPGTVTFSRDHSLTSTSLSKSSLMESKTSTRDSSCGEILTEGSVDNTNNNNGSSSDGRCKSSSDGNESESKGGGAGAVVIATNDLHNPDANLDADESGVNESTTSNNNTPPFGVANINPALCEDKCSNDSLSTGKESGSVMEVDGSLPIEPENKLPINDGVSNEVLLSEPSPNHSLLPSNNNNSSDNTHNDNIVQSNTEHSDNNNNDVVMDTDDDVVSTQSFVLRLSPSQATQQSRQSAVSSSQVTESVHSNSENDIIDLTGSLSNSLLNEQSQDIINSQTVHIPPPSLQETIDLTSPIPTHNSDRTIGNNRFKQSMTSLSALEPLTTIQDGIDQSNNTSGIRQAISDEGVTIDQSSSNNSSVTTCSNNTGSIPIPIDGTDNTGTIPIPIDGSNNTGSIPIPIDGTNNTGSIPIPIDGSNNTGTIPIPIDGSNNTGTIPIPIDGSNNTGTIPIPIDGSNNTGTIPIPIDGSNNTGSIPIPIDGTNNTGSIPIPIDGSNNTGTIPIPIDGSNNTGTIPIPIDGSNNTGTIPIPIDGSNNTGTIPIPIDGSNNTGTIPIPIDGSNNTGTIPIPIDGSNNTGTIPIPIDGSNNTGTIPIPIEGNNNTGTIPIPINGSNNTGTIPIPIDRAPMEQSNSTKCSNSIPSQSIANPAANDEPSIIPINLSGVNNVIPAPLQSPANVQSASPTEHFTNDHRPIPIPSANEPLVGTPNQQISHQSFLEPSFEDNPDRLKGSKPVYESIQCSGIDETPPLLDNTVQNTSTALSVSESPLSGSTPFQFRLPIVGSISPSLSHVIPSPQLFQATPANDHLTTPFLVSKTSSNNQGILPSDETTTLHDSATPTSNQTITPPSKEKITPPYDKDATLFLKQQATPPNPPLANDYNEKKRRLESSHIETIQKKSKPQNTTLLSTTTTRVVETNDSYNMQSEQVDTAGGDTDQRKSPDVPLISPFVISETNNGKDEQEGLNLDDSQNYVMPTITGMDDSEQESVFNTSFTITKPTAVSSSSLDSQCITTGTVARTIISHKDMGDQSEDPFEFNPNQQGSFVMPLRRKRKSRPPLHSITDYHQPSTISVSINHQLPIITPVIDTPTHSNVNIVSSSSTTPTNTKSVRFNSFVSSTPPCPHSRSPQSTPLNQFNPVLSLATPSPVLATPLISGPSCSTPVLFSSPSSFVQPQAIESITSSHPNARFVRLNHITKVTTIRQYISTEIIDVSSRQIIKTEFSEIPTDQSTLVSVQMEPLNDIPGSISSSHSSFSNTTNVSLSGIIPSVPHPVLPTCITGSIPIVTPLTPASQPLCSSVSSPQSSGLKESSFNSSLDVSKDSINLVSSSNSIVRGVLVIARWRDKQWYAAVVVKKLSKKVCVDYLDNDRDNVAMQHLLPLSKLPSGTPVIVRSDDNGPVTTDLSGSFIDYCSETKTFRLESPPGEINRYDLKHLLITSETALMLTTMKIASSDGGSNDNNSKYKSKIFSGYVFILTEKEQSGTDHGKNNIEDIIKSRGGIIMVDYKPTRVLDKKTFCLSNTHCRTLKYFIALGVNLPCVNYEFVYQCAKENKFVSYESYILPAGVSTLSKEVIMWKPRPKQFLKITVFLSGVREFKEFWGKVCTAGGAVVMSKLPSKTRNIRNVFVITATESRIPQSLRDMKEYVKLLKSDWLVESLVQGCIVNTEQFQL